MKIETTEMLTALFDKEADARKYLSYIRWGEWAQCPYCRNQKAYFIENGKRYKCANPKCHKKFSFTTRTLMMAGNISATQWLQIGYFFVKSRGRVLHMDMAVHAGISANTAKIAIDKCAFAWYRVDRENKSPLQLVQSLFINLFGLYDYWEDFKRIKYQNTFVVAHIDDISNAAQYDTLLNYCRIRLYCCEWIFLNFASPQDIMANVFLKLADDNIKDYDATLVVKYINRTISRMWLEYLKDHPNLWAQHEAKLKQRDYFKRVNITTQYLVKLVQSSKAGKGLTREDIKKNVELLEGARDKLKKYRKKAGGLMDFHSHFS